MPAHSMSWPAGLLHGLLRRGGRNFAVPLAAAATLLVLLLAVTLLMWRSSTALSAQAAHERFEFKVHETQKAIEQRLLAYEQILRGAVALFAANGDVDRSQWQRYVRTLEIEKHYLGIQGIGYAVRVPAGGIVAHVKRQRAEGFPDYAIQPPGERAEYAPIVQIAPLDWRNQRALGYDMLADPAMRATLERARDSGSPAVSGRVRLVQETGDGVQAGFVMCLPVYRGAPSAAERGHALQGHVCSTFRMQDLMEGILGTETLPDIQLRIDDGTQAAAAGLLYDSLEGYADAARPPASFRAEREFEFNGRRWSLRFDSLPAFDATVDTQKPRLILGGGSLISVLFAAVLGSLLLNRHRARALAKANQGLQAEITERARLETQLERARDAAEAASQAKSDFLANVSHELRTPLTLIMAPVEQLLAAPGGDAARVQLERVQRNAMLLMNRVNEILDFSKAEAGRFDVRPEVIDLRAWLEVIAGDAAAAAQAKGCTLSCDVAPALGSLAVDPLLLEKIVLNFVANAIKFTPAGGTISLQAAALGGGEFELAVEDSGIGIATDQLPLLFQRFSQVDHSATRHYGGTGIGLALVKQLAQAMGGRVGVTSVAGRGSRFFVHLPIGDAASADTDISAIPPPRDAAAAALRRMRLQGEAGVTPTPTPATPAAPAAEPGRRRPRVMVVDDTPDMRAYITELLQDECDIVTAADGELAWDALQQTTVDVVVSDVMMPNLDGIGLTERIKARAGLSHLPVILVTARGGGEASISGLESGADDYIAKPFSPAELKARVRAVLRMNDVQTELRNQSRRAGMAEIATNVLHNVGNVLNSINIAATLAAAKVRGSRRGGLTRAVALMQEHAADLGHFMAHDARGRQLPEYLAKLAHALDSEQHEVSTALGELLRSVDHVKEIIATQQSYASVPSVVVEAVSVRELVDDTLRMNAGALERHHVEVTQEIDEMPPLALDKHRVLLILINLVSNAKYACDGAPSAPHRITLQAALAQPDRLVLRVLDNGVGIAAEHLPRIFQHGFTTRANGHGFGLHSCAVAAKEMGGTLTAFSEGPGRGACFTLELPVGAARRLAARTRPQTSEAWA